MKAIWPLFALAASTLLYQNCSTQTFESLTNAKTLAESKEPVELLAPGEIKLLTEEITFTIVPQDRPIRYDACPDLSLSSHITLQDLATGATPMTIYFRLSNPSDARRIRLELPHQGIVPDSRHMQVGTPEEIADRCGYLNKIVSSLVYTPRAAGAEDIAPFTLISHIGFDFDSLINVYIHDTNEFLGSVRVVNKLQTPPHQSLWA